MSSNSLLIGITLMTGCGGNIVEGSSNESVPGGERATDGLAREFSYDASSGRCVNSRGVCGLNRASESRISSTRDAQCADLSNYFFTGPDNVNTSDKPHVLRLDNFQGLDLQGADLRDSKGGAYVFLVDSKLRGANLSSYKFGYAKVSGWIDTFTQLPSFKPTCKPNPVQDAGSDAAEWYYCVN